MTLVETDIARVCGFRHQKKDPIKYEGGRELDDLVKFLQEHSTVLPPPADSGKKDEL